MKEKPMISFTTERLLVRPVSEEDKEEYMQLREKTSDIRYMYSEDPEFRESEWQSELNGKDDIYFSVFLKDSNTFVASASYQNYRKKFVELGLDVVEDYRHQGIGTELLTGLIETAHRSFPRATLKVRTRKKNTTAQKMIEKCGGKLVRKEEGAEVSAIRRTVKMMDAAGDKIDGWPDKKQLCLELIEKGKDGVFVYLINKE